MRTNDQRHRYQTDGMQSVSPERLLILLYERLQRDVREAGTAIAAKETESRHHALVHAQQIVEELAYAVRPQAWEGGDSLIAIYDYLLGLLVQANVEARRAPLDEAGRIIGDLLEAWRGAYLAVTPEAASA